MTKHDALKKNYRKTFELSVIISVVTVFGLLHAWPKMLYKPILGDLKEVSITVVNEIPQTFQYRKPIPPRHPTIPLPVVGLAFPENEFIEQLDFDLTGVAPPPEPNTSIYEEFIYIPHEIPPYPQKGYAYLNRLVEYPEFALKRHIQGRVVLGILIDEAGKAEKITIIQESGRDVGFEIAAVRAARKIEWFPAKQRGKPVKVWVALPVKFEVQEESFLGWAN